MVFAAPTNLVHAKNIRNIRRQNAHNVILHGPGSKNLFLALGTVQLLFVQLLHCLK